MDIAENRVLMTHLADDLSWLEQLCLKRPEQAQQASQLRLAASLVRNCVGPFLDNQSPVPLHIVVVGGAGAGKSTVANFLTGAVVAESNPQAGFTRHPVAYVSSNGPVTWTGHPGFLGPLQRLQQASPSNLDADVYQVRRVDVESDGYSLLRNFVVWDCPDMTTWAAAGYGSRLVEVAGLADVIVYVASDERYNDEVPTEFLRLLLQTGKPVVVCLMKMKEADAQAIVAHFQKEVARKLPPGIVAYLPIPHLTAAQLADPVRLAGKYRIPLVNQIAVLGEPTATARRRTVQGANRYLVTHEKDLLSSVRQDVMALQNWRELVQSGQVEFDNRYRREYLNSQQFRLFDEALVRLLDLLEIPGVGKILSGALYMLRTPYRLLRSWLGKTIIRPPVASPPELAVLEEALTGWLDLLRKEAAQQADFHPLWAYVEKGFAHSLGEQARDRFQQNYRAFQLCQTDEIDRTARAIYEDLEKNPAVLNTLRGGKFLIDVAAIGGTLALGGIGWHDVILVPLAASITHQLVELLGQNYVDNQRELARQRQQMLMAQYVSRPLAEWLMEWPITGGSEFERLQLALRRIPEGIRKLDSEIRKHLAAAR